MVGDFAQAVIRNVIDGDAERFRRRQINIVDAEAEPADRLATRQLPKEFARKFGIGDENGIGVARHGEDVIRRRAFRHAVFGIKPRQHLLGRLERRKRTVGDGDDGAGHEVLRVLVIAGKSGNDAREQTLAD